MADKILEIKNLKTYFRTDAGLVKAVNPLRGEKPWGS
jgi:hypothetical protein